MDHVIGVFFAQLEQLGFMKNTIVVALGDHGESLGEHGEPDHGYYVYDSTIRIPWIISWPGQIKAAVITEQVQEIDLLPTLADLIGFKTDGSIQGKSLARLLEGKKIELPAAYTESLTPKLYYGWSELTSIRTNDWKYIEAPEPELYNLKEDPHEVNNLISLQADKARLMREQLLKMIAIGHKAQQKTETMDAERLEQLASLGYIGALNPSAMLNSNSNIDPKSKLDDYLLHHKLVPQAVAEIDQGKYQVALNTLKKVEAKFTNSFVLYWYMGLCYAKLNQLEEAQKQYSHTIELNPYFGRAYTDLALTLQLMGRSQEAMKLLDTIPDSAISIADRDFTRGEIQMNQSDFQRAEQSYTSALQSDPGNAEVEYALARLYMATGRIDEAVSKMRSLTEMNYRSEDVYYSLSTIYLKQGKSEESEKILKQWLEQYPNSAAAHYRYGLFLALKGNRKQAVVYLERAVQIDPSLKEAAMALAEVKKAT
jgi:tetratricopeptide (TPR) repeat protein